MTAGPRVSVILPAYNAKRYIATAVESVLDQTFRDFELIVVDDASSDGTSEAIRQIEDARVKCLRQEKNLGPCGTRNTGLKEARGECIAFLDSDDAWERSRLEKLIIVSEGHPDSFVGSDLMLCFSDPSSDKLVPWRSFFEERKYKIGPLHRATMSEFIRYGLDIKPIFPAMPIRKYGIHFLEEYFAHDWLFFFLQCLRQGLSFLILNEPLYYQRIHPGTHSGQYATVLNLFQSSRFLLETDWLDEDAKREIKRISKKNAYRLITSALKERRWGKALSHTLRHPAGLLSILKEMPRHFFRKAAFRRKKPRGKE